MLHLRQDRSPSHLERMAVVKLDEIYRRLAEFKGESADIFNAQEVRFLLDEVERTRIARDEAWLELFRVTREANEKICRILNEQGLSTVEHPLISSNLLGRIQDDPEWKVVRDRHMEGINKEGK